MFKVLKRTENRQILMTVNVLKFVSHVQSAEADGEQNIDNCGNVLQLVMFRVLKLMENRILTTVSRVQSAEEAGKRTDIDNCGNVLQFISRVHCAEVDGEKTDIDDCGNVTQFISCVQSTNVDGEPMDIDDWEYFAVCRSCSE